MVDPVGGMEQSIKKELAQRIGRRLRRFREEAGLTLKQLAEASALSAPFLSRIEHSRTMPSVPTLQVIADALKVDVESFFRQEEERRFVISLKNSRRKVFAVRGEEKKVNYEMELLAEGMDSPLMEPALVTALVRGGEVDLNSHGGQEFCYVVEGEVEVTLGSHRFHLQPGDAAYWDGRLPHGAVSLGPKPSKTLNVHLVPGKRTGSFQTHELAPLRPKKKKPDQGPDSAPQSGAGVSDVS